MTDLEKLIWGAVASLFVALVVWIIKLLSEKRSDQISLKGNLKASTDIDILNTIGCAGLILTIICKSKRPAKIKESYISLVVDPEFVESFEKGFGVPFRHNPELPAPTVMVKLIPIYRSSTKNGYVLERDDVCKFMLPIQIPFLHKFIEAKPESVSIYVKYTNEDKIILMKGLEVQKAIRDLIDIHGKLPMNLKIPLSIALSVSTKMPPDSSVILGKTNPNPIKFHSKKEEK